ncbi:hypothetical protein FOZ63_013017, partial [Perkinsus olseni]
VLAEFSRKMVWVRRQRAAPLPGRQFFSNDPASQCADLAELITKNDAVKMRRWQPTGGVPGRRSNHTWRGLRERNYKGGLGEVRKSLFEVVHSKKQRGATLQRFMGAVVADARQFSSVLLNGGGN